MRIETWRQIDAWLAKALACWSLTHGLGMLLAEKSWPPPLCEHKAARAMTRTLVGFLLTGIEKRQAFFVRLGPHVSDHDPGHSGTCDSGRWTHYDVCEENGCFRFSALKHSTLLKDSERMHTGDSCPGKGDCWYANKKTLGGTPVTCVCTDGRFICDDELFQDAGVADTRRD